MAMAGGGVVGGSLNVKQRQRQAVQDMLRETAAGQQRGMGYLNGEGASSANGSSSGSGDLMGSWSDEWKLLVYDAHCRDIISTLLNVTQLRKLGVTLHMPLEQEREPITDVPALYFCQPTPENLQQVAKDCSRLLYASVSLNLSSKLERPLMESLAKQVTTSGSAQMVSKIVDRYLDFVSLEPRLFHLNQPGSFLAYNHPSCGDTQITAAMTAVSYGLLSVLATLKVVPVIRAPRGGAAEMVARQLNSLISDHLLGGGGKAGGGGGGAGGGGGGGGLFSSGGVSSYQRPVLVLLDRTGDLISALRHNSTYQALLDDLLNHRLNRITVDVSSGKGGAGGGGAGAAAKRQRKTYDVNCETDAFYAQHKGASFPEAIEANGMELAQVTQEEEDIRRRTSAAGISLEGVQGGSITSSAAAHSAAAAAAGGGAKSGGGTHDLAAAVESLPALLERKKKLEMHTNILKAVMDIIAEREVPVLFEAEESMVSANRGDRATVVSLVQTGKGSLRDKLRLLGVYVLVARPSPPELGELQEVLRAAYGGGGGQAGGNGGGGGGGGGGEGDASASSELENGIAALTYLRQQVALQHMPTAVPEGATSEGPASGGAPKFMQGLLAKAQTGATGLLAKAAATAGQLLSRANMTYVTAALDALLEHKEEDEAFLFLDPKLRSGGSGAVGGMGGAADPASAAAAAAASRARAPPRDAIVFMIGGGTYTEFQNLQDYASTRARSGKGDLGVTYGCTELLNADGFLTQLMSLGGASA